MTRVLIMAAGASTRWEDLDTPKHLVDVGGELLIQRIVRQVQERGFDPVVVTHSAEIATESAVDRTTGRPPITVLWPKRHRLIVDTLMSTKELWQSPTVILLGDVIYSRACMNLVLNDNSGLQFYGTRYEIFALRFTRFDDIEYACKHVVIHAYKNKYSPNVGKLWSLYRFLASFDLMSHEFEDNMYTFIEDYTMDLDYVRQYNDKVLPLINMGRLDNMPKVGQ